MSSSLSFPGITYYNHGSHIHILAFLKGSEGRRGPKGEPGSSGEKGDPGSFDFLMLMVADLRHDLEQLKSRGYPNGGSLPESRTDSPPSVSD